MNTFRTFLLAVICTVGMLSLSACETGVGVMEKEEKNNPKFATSNDSSACTVDSTHVSNDGESSIKVEYDCDLSNHNLSPQD